jgi:hypothetical protein
MTDPNVKKTVRNQLPVREPTDKAGLPIPAQPDAGAGSGPQNLNSSERSRPIDQPSISPPLSAAVVPSPEPPSSGVKTETARILLTTQPVPSTDQTKNAEPVIPMPQVVPQDSSIAAKPAHRKSSMLLSWMLLAVSALILIIQIWIYLS